jgi:hypothetical protein
MCIPIGTCLADADCSEGNICDLPTKKCVPGSMCGGLKADTAIVPANILINVDRSCSMTNKVGGVPKWTIAVNALVKLTTDYKDKLRWGLTLFPDITAPNCVQGNIPIPVGPGKEASIQTLLNNALAKSDPYYPDGPCVTPIDAAMAQAKTEPAFTDKTRASYVILLSDGAQAGCNQFGGDNGTTQIITDLRVNQGVKTFVIGFGSGVDAAGLNKFADAGGVPYSDPLKPTQHYYQAEDQVGLEAVFASIAQKTLSCTYALGTVPPDANKIYVFFDKKDQISQDPTHAAGWDYDGASNQITFFGSTCADLTSGKVAALDVVFNCPVIK